MTQFAHNLPVVNWQMIDKGISVAFQLERLTDRPSYFHDNHNNSWHLFHTSQNIYIVFRIAKYACKSLIRSVRKFNIKFFEVIKLHGVKWQI